MNNEDEFDLRPDQWETLKALRAPATTQSASKRFFVLDDLVALGLVIMENNVPALTPNGRKALIRGSFRLWNVAA